MLFSSTLPLLALASSTLAGSLLPPRNNDGHSKPVSTHPQVTIEGDVCRVKALGGARDDSSALLYAFETCNENAYIDLPYHYTVGKVLNTTLKNVEINLAGTIQYTPDITYWNASSIYLTYQNASTFWLFQGSHVTMYGGGTIDGNGQIWWNTFAQNSNAGAAGGSSTTFQRPVPFTVGNAEDILIDNIQIVNSPFWSQFVYQSTRVTFANMRIESTSYDPEVEPKNSDAWDIYRSSHVTIRDSWVNVGDDCVSFKPNTTNVEVYNMWCNGTHGTSIGSLGQYAGEVDIVSDIYVNNITMLNAQNGARIKVWGGSPDPNSVTGGGSGYVRNVTFTNYEVQNVDYPIVITACYFTDAETCAAYPSPLLISDIHYDNFFGTSSGKRNATVFDLQCSATCQNITATNIDISPPDAKYGEAEYICKNIADLSLIDLPCNNA